MLTIRSLEPNKTDSYFRVSSGDEILKLRWIVSSRVSYQLTYFGRKFSECHIVMRLHKLVRLFVDL